MCGSSRSNSTKKRARPARNRGSSTTPAARKRASSCVPPMCHTRGTEAPPLSTSTSPPQATFFIGQRATFRKLRHFIESIARLLAARTPRSPLQNLPVCVWWHWCPQAPTSTANQHTPRCELHTAAACESTATCGFSAPGAAAIRPPQATSRATGGRTRESAHRTLFVCFAEKRRIVFCELLETLLRKQRRRA